MAKLFKLLGTILAVLFAILFILSTVLTLVVFNFERNLFEPDLYIQALTEQEIYAKIPNLAAQAILSRAQSEDAGEGLAVFSPLSERELTRFLRAVLPPEQVKLIVDDLVIQVLGFLTGENDSVVLSISELKQHLASPVGMRAIFELLQKQPPCSVDQLNQLVREERGLIICAPPESFLGFQTRPIIEAQIKAALLFLPEEETLASVDDEFSELRISLGETRRVLRLSPVLAFVFLLMVTLLAVRSLRDWFGWWGFPLLVAGWAGMAVNIFVTPLFNAFFESLVAVNLPPRTPDSLTLLVKDVLGTIFEKSLEPLIFQSIMLAGLGIVLAVIAMFMHRDTVYERSEAETILE